MCTSSRTLDECHAGSAGGDLANVAAVVAGGEALAAPAAQLLLGQGNPWASRIKEAHCGGLIN